MRDFNPYPPFADVKDLLCMRELQNQDCRNFLITMMLGLGMDVAGLEPRVLSNLAAMKSRDEQIMWMLRRSPYVNKKGLKKRILENKKQKKTLLSLAVEYARDMDHRTQEKVLCSSPLAHVHERLGVRPMVFFAGSKDETPSIEKFREFVVHLAVRLQLLGIGIVGGLGPNVMKIAPEIFLEIRPRVEEACREANIHPVWEYPAPVAGITLNIDGEPISSCFDEGLHAGPFRSLEPRGMALLSLGCTVGTVAFTGGDSTILEVMQAITATKESHQAALETPVLGDAPVILVDDSVRKSEQGTKKDRRMWLKFLECYDFMCRSKIDERRKRKEQQARKLWDRYIELNGGPMEVLAMQVFEDILVGCRSVYGGSPMDYWVQQNGITEQLGVIVQRFLDGKPLRG